MLGLGYMGYYSGYPSLFCCQRACLSCVRMREAAHSGLHVFFTSLLVLNAFPHTMQFLPFTPRLRSAFLRPLAHSMLHVFFTPLLVLNTFPHVTHFFSTSPRLDGLLLILAHLRLHVFFTPLPVLNSFPHTIHDANLIPYFLVFFLYSSLHSALHVFLGPWRRNSLLQTRHLSYFCERRLLTGNSPCMERI